MDYFGDEKKNNNAYLLDNEEISRRSSSVTDLYGASRTLFIRKVYTILAGMLFIIMIVQLLITTIMTLFSIYN